MVSSNSPNGASHRYRGQRRRDRLGEPVPGRNNMPSESVHSHDAGVGEAGPRAGRESDELVRAVVVTLAVNVVGVVALNARLDGTEQPALAGMPVQLSEAVPLIPWPPMESV
jgi:hypothetical protein